MRDIGLVFFLEYFAQEIVEKPRVGLEMLEGKDLVLREFVPYRVVLPPKSGIPDRVDIPAPVRAVM